jgi:hypothetical protein
MWVRTLEKHCLFFYPSSPLSRATLCQAHGEGAGQSEALRFVGMGNIPCQGRPPFPREDRFEFSETFRIPGMRPQRGKRRGRGDIRTCTVSKTLVFFTFSAVVINLGLKRALFSVLTVFNCESLHLSKLESRAVKVVGAILRGRRHVAVTLLPDPQLTAPPLVCGRQ